MCTNILSYLDESAQRHSCLFDRMFTSLFKIKDTSTKVINLNILIIIIIIIIINILVDRQYYKIIKYRWSN
jgi:hypothetical protein